MDRIPPVKKRPKIQCLSSSQETHTNDFLQEWGTENRAWIQIAIFPRLDNTIRQLNHYSAKKRYQNWVIHWIVLATLWTFHSVKNNDLIGWMRKNNRPSRATCTMSNRAERAARTLNNGSARAASSLMKRAARAKHTSKNRIARAKRA